MKSTLDSITRDPAFPADAFPTAGHLPAVPGMTLRDWFAGVIMAGAVANGGLCYVRDVQRLARQIYEHADALLEARDGENTEGQKE